MTKKLEISPGDRYNRLVVLAEVPNKTGRKFRMLCDCGKEVVCFLNNLRKNHTTSCGCFAIETYGQNSRTHGKFGTKVYKAWQEMKNRCLNQRSEHYCDYGGRGISIQEDWLSCFENFYAHIGDPPDGAGKFSIDRISVNGNYEAGNVRWATQSSQNRNRRMFKNNTSGYTGVSIRDYKGNMSAVAFWRTLDGKEKRKSFSEKKFGPRYVLIAAEYRSKQIDTLNLQGADYGSQHGQQHCREDDKVDPIEVLRKYGIE